MNEPGLIESAGGPAPSQPAEPGGSPLDQIEQGLRSKIPKEDQLSVEKVVTAGRKWMYSPKTSEIALSKIKADDPDSIAMGVAALITILQRQSKMSMPPQVIMPAAMLLLVEALRLVQDAEIAQVTPEFIANAAQGLMGYMAQKAGVKPPEGLERGAPPVAPTNQGGLIAAAQGQA